MASSKRPNPHSATLIVPRQLSFDSSVDGEICNKSISNRSSISYISFRHHPRPSISSSIHPTLNARSTSFQVGPSIDTLTNYSDDDDDLDDSVSARENYRLAPQVIRSRRRNSSYSNAQQQRASASNKSDVLFIQARLPGKISVPEKHSSFLNSGYISMIDEQAAAAARSSKELRGQTLLHLAARLGHDEILRLLICETSQAGMLMNARGQTPLLTAIEAGSTSVATLLMESDPRSITVSDDSGSSVFHYACEHCNDIVLNRAIALLKRLNSTSDRITGLRRITERNRSGKTAFDIAIGQGQLNCIKQFLLSSWLDANIDIGELINADSLRNAVNQDQLDVLSFFVTDAKRFTYIIHLLIDVDGQYFNLLEYAIYLKKKDIVRLFISVRIPIENYTHRQQYKSFLQHCNVPFIQSGSFSFYETPLQRMLTTPELVPLVPIILEQFINNNAIDLSIIDDCLYARPGKLRCVFGRTKSFSTANWLEQHPLTLIAKANCKAVSDHPLVRMCVDLKFNLFGNFFYFLILCCQSTYVTLYTSIALISPTPADQNNNYYQMVNYSCNDLCLTLANDPINPAQDQPSIRAFRFILLIVSGLGLLKEFHQILTQREKYFHRFYINLLELHMHVSAIIYCVDVNECTRQTGIRCSAQWMAGGIGLLSVWTSLLLVVMNGIKFGKHGLLFITVFVTLLKFIAVYIFIWIGYILAFYMIGKDVLDQFHFFNFVPKLLVMFIGEYDLDSTWFGNNNTMLPGAEGILILYAAYIFTMIIVMTNIMGGLAVADVKEFRLNAKREHLRARIGVVLGFQAYVGGFCEIIGSTTMRLCKNEKWVQFLKRFNIAPMKYQLEKLEIRSYPVNIPHNFLATYYSASVTRAHREQDVVQSSLFPRSDVFDQVHPETGFYVHRSVVQNDSLFNEDDSTRSLKKTDEVRGALEESAVRTNNELRKVALDLQNELEDVKRRLIQQKILKKL